MAAVRAALVVVLALALAAPAQAILVQFRTPTANIGCVYSSEAGRYGPYLRCDILSGLRPKPRRPKGCTLDWTFGFQMSRTGPARTVCAGDTAVDKRAEVALKNGRPPRLGAQPCPLLPLLVPNRDQVQARGRRGRPRLAPLSALQKALQLARRALEHRPDERPDHVAQEGVGGDLELERVSAPA